VPRPTGNPRIDKLVERIEQRIGRPVACPCCGGTDWVAITDFVRVVYLTEPYTETSGQDQLGEFQNLRTVVLICGTCAFARSHMIAED
jgi:hypothetical protein